MMRYRSLAALAALAVLGACGEGSTAPANPTPPKGVVVLSAVGALKGVNVTTDTGGFTTRVPFAPEFDGAAMRLESDTILTTSSSFGTNKMYIVSLADAASREVEMPASGNPAGAVLAHGFLGANAVVALRGDATIGLVTLRTGGAPTVARIGGVGRCPYDAAMHGAAELWVVDYDAACNDAYQSLGDSRLVRVTSASARDTVPLPGVKNATSIVVVGDLAYVAALGVAQYAPDFSSVAFVAPGSVTAVDLRSRSVVRTLSLPAGTNGAAMARGQDGRLYVTAYVNTAYETGVFVIDPQTMTYAVAPAARGITLRKTAGGAPQCAVATADQLGRLFCPENQGASQTTTMYVFDLKTGAELRHFATGGTGAMDIALR